MFRKKSKKVSKTKKDSKLRVAKSSSKAPGPSSPVVEAPLLPTPTPPACVLNLEPLPWSEWTWDTNQHFHFRARMGPDGWEYEYKLPPNYMKKRDQMWQHMTLPNLTRPSHDLTGHGTKHTRSEEDGETGSGSEGDTIHGSVESASGSDSESDNSSQTGGSSEDGYGTEARAGREGRRHRKGGGVNPFIVVTRKHKSGEVIVEVIDSRSTRKRNESSARETSDWGYTSEDEW